MGKHYFEFCCLFFFFFLFGPAIGALHQLWQRQPVDHIGFGNESLQTFQQRVFVDDSYVQGGQQIKDGAPILVYLGGEDSIDNSIYENGVVSFVTYAAFKLQALLVYIEHRFYGQSVPFGSIDLAMEDPEVRGCLNSVQALADFAEVIVGLKQNMSVPKSPVIVLGGSYSGMLAVWFRMKYPHIAIGALASSAPILNSEDLPLDAQYCSIVSRDFKDANGKCYQRISRSWEMINNVASQPMDNLSQIFMSCSPHISGVDLKDYLAEVYDFVAQYNGPFGSLIKLLCDQISNASELDLLGGIGRALLSLTGNKTCNNITLTPHYPTLFGIDRDSLIVWDWQTCSELIPYNRGCNENALFERRLFDLPLFMEECNAKYGVYPHPHAMSTYYDGQDIKSALKTFGTNIIFSNGLKDPFSGASILEDMSDTVVAITTDEGSHCLDLEPLRTDDPKWLKQQRDKELKILAQWIKDSRASNSGLPNWTSWLLIVVSVIYAFPSLLLI